MSISFSKSEVVPIDEKRFKTSMSDIKNDGRSPKLATGL